MKLELNDYLILIAASFVALSIGIILTYYLGKLLANNITKINYKLLTLAIISFVVLLVGLFSGWLGILVLSISTAMGMIAPIVGTKRTHVMGCLVIPVVSYFL